MTLYLEYLSLYLSLIIYESLVNAISPYVKEVLELFKYPIEMCPE